MAARSCDQTTFPCQTIKLSPSHFYIPSYKNIHQLVLEKKIFKCFRIKSNMAATGFHKFQIAAKLRVGFFCFSQTWKYSTTGCYTPNYKSMCWLVSEKKIFLVFHKIQNGGQVTWPVENSWVRCTSSHGPTSSYQVSEVSVQWFSQSSATKNQRNKKKEEEEEEEEKLER